MRVTMLGLLLLGGGAAWAQETFPFVMPLTEASPTVISLARLNRPITAASRLAVRGGHFVDGAGNRVRLVGVNLTAAGCFPDPALAPLIAARLRKLGVNIVRLHHMDAPWAVPGLFSLDQHGYGRPTLTLDPRSLDRLDRFVAELKQQGIYLDLNLHVSREWSAANGFPEGTDYPALGKVVSYFHPRALALQEQFIDDLLTHRNPYTGLTYAADPVVGLVELTNEDALVAAADELDTLPPATRELLRQAWNGWLQARYPSTAALLQAWNREAEPLGDNLLPNARFADGTAGWAFERHGGAAYDAGLVTPAGAEAPAGKALRISHLRVTGTGWHAQFNCPRLTLEDGTRYTVSFAARADRPRVLRVVAMLDQAPWSTVGQSFTVALTPAWARHALTFTARGTVPGHVRLNVTAGDSDIPFEVAELALQRGGGQVRLPPGTTLEAGDLPLLAPADSPAGADLIACLMAIERQYAARLRARIRRAGCPAPVTCSQAGYGGAAGLAREAGMDWIDTHAYWQHPSFPRRAWDREDWRIGNTSMVADAGGGTLFALARCRVAGMPFTVSEYDHPAPSEYAAESLPMLFAIAARQDWDGVFLFNYDVETGDLRTRASIPAYFDQSSHPGKAGLLPSMALCFRTGRIPAAPAVLTLELPTAQLPRLTAATRGYAWGGESVWTLAGGTPVGLADGEQAAPAGGEQLTLAELLSAQLAVRLTDGAALRLLRPRARVPRPNVVPGPPPAVAWRPAEGRFTFAVPTALGLCGRATTAAWREADAAVTLERAPAARNFGVLTLISLDGRPIPRAGALLLTALDKAENPGLQWNAERTFAANSQYAGLLPRFKQIQAHTIAGILSPVTPASPAVILSFS